MDSKKNVLDLPDDLFIRKTGISKETFRQALDVVVVAERNLKTNGGRNNYLCAEERLMMLIERIKNDISYLDLGINYNISESASFRNCKWLLSVLSEKGMIQIKEEETKWQTDHKKFSS
jgi:hypothetical protein